MSLLARRQRSAGELVFGVLRTLLCGYRLWGTRSSMHVSELADTLGAHDRRVLAAVSYLESEGFLLLTPRGNVRLTAAGASRLLAATGAEASRVLA